MCARCPWQELAPRCQASRRCRCFRGQQEAGYCDRHHRDQLCVITGMAAVEMQQLAMHSQKLDEWEGPLFDHCRSSLSRSSQGSPRPHFPVKELQETDSAGSPHLGGASGKEFVAQATNARNRATPASTAITDKLLRTSAERRTRGDIVTDKNPHQGQRAKKAQTGADTAHDQISTCLQRHSVVQRGCDDRVEQRCHRDIWRANRDRCNTCGWKTSLTSPAQNDPGSIVTMSTSRAGFPELVHQRMGMRGEGSR